MVKMTEHFMDLEYSCLDRKFFLSNSVNKHFYFIFPAIFYKNHTLG